MNLTVKHPSQADQNGYITPEADLFVFYRAGRKGAAHPDLSALIEFLSARGWVIAQG